MKTKLFGLVMILANALAACDSTTDTLGNSLTEDIDQLIISTDTFAVETRSIAAKSVLGRNTIGHIGRMKDPETGAHIKTEFMAQFNIQEGLKLPGKNQILSKDDDGNIIADSCEIWMVSDAFLLFTTTETGVALRAVAIVSGLRETVVSSTTALGLLRIITALRFGWRSMSSFSSLNTSARKAVKSRVE